MCLEKKGGKKIMPVPSYSRNRNKLAEQNEFEWSVGIKKNPLIVLVQSIGYNITVEFRLRIINTLK